MCKKKNFKGRCLSSDQIPNFLPIVKDATLKSATLENGHIEEPKILLQQGITSNPIGLQVNGGERNLKKMTSAVQQQVLQQQQPWHFDGKKAENVIKYFLDSRDTIDQLMLIQEIYGLVIKGNEKLEVELYLDIAKLCNEKYKLDFSQNIEYTKIFVHNILALPLFCEMRFLGLDGLYKQDKQIWMAIATVAQKHDVEKDERRRCDIPELINRLQSLGFRLPTNKLLGYLVRAGLYKKVYLQEGFQTTK